MTICRCKLMNTDIAVNNDEVKSGAPVSVTRTDPVSVTRTDGETVAAIAAAIALHTNGNVHDRESYVITIRRRQRERDVCYLD